MRLLESGEPWFAAAQALLVGVAVALAVGVGVRLLARRILRHEDRAQQISLIAFWGVVGIFALVAIARLFGGEAAEAGLTTAGNRLYTTLPDLVIGVVVIVVGFVLATAARNAVSKALADSRPRYADSAGNAASTAILVTAVLLAIRQIGVQTVLVDALVIAAGAGAALAVGLALGIGGRHYAEAVAAGRHAESILTVGDLIEVDGRRGRVLRIGSTSVRLGLPGGAIAEIPHQRLLAETVVVFEHDEDPGEPAAEAGATAAGATGAASAPPSAPPPQPDEPEPAEPLDEVDDEAPTRVFEPAPPAPGVTRSAPPVDHASSAEREPTSVLDREELARERERLRQDPRA